MDIKELTQERLDNLLAERDELIDKLDKANASIERLKSQLALAQKGLRMANVDSLPKEVADDARRRMELGLDDHEAIHCAIKQYEHDQAQKKQKKA